MCITLISEEGKGTPIFEAILDSIQCTFQKRVPGANDAVVEVVDVRFRDLPESLKKDVIAYWEKIGDTASALAYSNHVLSGRSVPDPNTTGLDFDRAVCHDEPRYRVASTYWPGRSS